jgi:hypothetical protein
MARSSVPAAREQQVADAGLASSRATGQQQVADAGLASSRAAGQQQVADAGLASSRAAGAPHSRRGVRRGRRTAVIAVLALAGGGVAFVVASPSGSSGSSASPLTPGPATATAPVRRADVITTLVETGTLDYAGSYTVTGTGSGTVTRLPAVGAVVRRGQGLYQVDGQPVRLLYGLDAAWRAFSLGMTDGPDVRELEANLVALGYDPYHDITVDDTFTWATAAAIERWQSALGEPVTGTLPLGAVVFLPGALRVTGVSATPGGSDSGPILAGTSSRQVVSVSLPLTDQVQLAVGDRVQVTLPDGSTDPGVVTTVSAVATSQNAGGTQSGGNTSGGDAVPVTIRLQHPPAGRPLDQAQVQVNVITAEHDNVLTVPITALLPAPGGTEQVVIVNHTGRHTVPVTTGLFDDRAGTVEISGPGISAGDRVEVPVT